MRSTITRSLLLGTALLLGIWLFRPTAPAPSQLTPEPVGDLNTPPEKDKYTNMNAAAQQEFDKTKDPATGDVPRERLIEAWEYTQELLKNSPDAPITGITWNERGPNNVPGRTRAFLIDPDVNGRVWAAGVSGGLWRSENIYGVDPGWVVVDDFFDNLAITTLAMDPNNSNIIYFGTGEGFFNADAVRGDGIWKSTDRGATWTQLGATAGDNNFQYVQKIVVHPGTGDVLAACRSVFTNRGGVMRSTDGGTSWSRVLSGGTGIFWAADIELAANNDLYASIGIGFGDGIYKSTNSGVTWTQVYTAGGSEQRIELGTAPSDANYVYALVEGASNAISQVMRTTNGGTSWITLGATSWSDQCAAPVADFTRGQAFYDLAVDIDPNDRDRAYIGGVDVFLTTNGGTSWTQVTEWADCSGLEDIHADQHFIMYKPGASDTCFFGNDGGVYYSLDANAASPTFESRGEDFNTTQFYSCALEPTANSNQFMGGTQDNGTNRFTQIGMNATTEVTGGDGGFCHIDQTNSLFWFSAGTRSRIFRSVDGGTSFSTILSSTNGSFINPSDYDNTNDNFYAGRTGGTYLLGTGMTGTPSFFNSGTIAAFSGADVTAVTVSPNTANRVFFGLDNGRVVRVNNASTAPAGTHINSGAGMPGSTVSCIEVEDGDDNHILVTYSSFGVTSVWETFNGGTSWTSVEGNLPDMPIRWALFNPNNNDQALLATELGVWSTDNLNGGSTVWGASNSGLANVRVDMLQTRTSDNLVLAATHGRGMYTSDIFVTSPSADFRAERTLDYFNKSIQFFDGSFGATTWLWDFGDGNTSTLQNPTHTYTAAGQYTVTLTINGGADTETKTNYMLILPNRGTPYLPANGGNFDTNVLDFGSTNEIGDTDLWERGVPTNQITTVNSAPNVWKTDLDADVTEGDYTCVLQSPSFNMTAAGTYTLSFRKSMEVQFCNAPFAARVEYSTDRGISWTRLGIENDASGTNWYDRGPTTGCSVSGSIFSDGRGFVSNYTNENTTFDISFLAGNSDVAFRYNFTVAAGFSAAGYGRDGFMVDDFQISGPVNSEISLPVEFGALSGTFVEEGVQLYWSTFQEINNRGFEVERSVDGINFNSLGFVPGAVESESRKQYQYLDGTATADVYFYRLRQLDLDGNFSFSNVVEVSRVTAAPEMTVSPNPFNNYVRIDQAEEVEQMRLIDAQGRMIKVQQGNGENSQQIDLSSLNLPAGIYFLHVRAEGQNKTYRLVKF